MNDKKKLFITFFLFLSFQLVFILWHNFEIVSDDFNYLMMGKLISEGLAPYKDFFVAHPPLQFILYASLIKLFGLKLWIVNVIPLTSIMVSAFISYKLTSKWYVPLIFLAMFPIFHLSSIGFGLNLGLMFVMLAIYTKNPYLSGIFAGLAVFSRLHFIPIVFSGLTMHKTLEKKSKYLVGGSIMAALFLFMFILLPKSMESIIFYHAFKDLQYFTAMRFFLIGIGLSGLLVAFRTKYFWMVLSFFTFLMVQKTIFAYYLIPLGALLTLAIHEKGINKQGVALFLSAMLGLSLGATILTIQDIRENKAEIRSLIDTVSTLEGKLCGNNEILPLLAFKTNKRIKNNEIDTNYQRKKYLNCSDSIAVHRLREFENCELIKKEKKYKISLCH